MERGTTLDKVLIINGDPETESMATELIDFKTETSCVPKLRFPKPLKKPFGGHLSDRDFLICGGNDENKDPQKTCYHLDLYKNDEFVELNHQLVMFSTSAKWRA